MLDSFPSEDDDISEFTKQADIIKSRYAYIKECNPTDPFSLRIIMCNLRLTFDYNTTRDESGNSLYTEFVESYTNFGKFIYSIATYAYVKLGLDHNRFLVCNYIRFKSPNPFETSVYYNSNSIINWVLGGMPYKTGYAAVSPNFHLILPDIEQLTVDNRTDRHYIWAGYAMVNIIHKYTDEIFIHNIIYGFPPIVSNRKELEDYNHFIKNDLKMITYGDYSSCNYIMNSNRLHKVFYKFEMNGVGGKKTEKNCRLIDITCEYAYSIDDDHFPNICEWFEV